MYEERFMRRAIELSKSALTTPGTKPFGGVVVKDGEIVGEGLNHSLEHFDPTSHGEVEAIRDACRRLRTLDLTGAHMYASTEPCTLCVAAMVLTGFVRLYYAASLDQAVRIQAKVKSGTGDPVIDPWTVRDEAGSPVDRRRIRSKQKLDAEAVGVLEQWAAQKTGGA
jgi:tRNA(Arg) A34 adenosine deaminase TadA